MFRYKLRTLLILLAVGPPMLAGVWWLLQWLGLALLVPLYMLLVIALLTLGTVVRQPVKE